MLEKFLVQGFASVLELIHLFETGAGSGKQNPKCPECKGLVPAESFASPP